MGTGVWRKWPRLQLAEEFFPLDRGHNLWIVSL